MTTTTTTTTTPTQQPPLPLLAQCLQRQLEELEAIGLIYGDGGGGDTDRKNNVNDDDDPTSTIHIASAPRALARRAVAEAEEGGGDGGLLQLWLLPPPQQEAAAGEEGGDATPPLLSLTVGRSPCLHIQLPALYPEKGHPPRLRWAEGANRGKRELEGALLRLAEVSEAHDEHGGEHLLEIVQAFQQLEAERRQAEKEEEERESEHAAAAAAAVVEAPRALLRVLVYFHHIINATKRDVVRREAVAHGLGGYSKIGWPGVVVVEGEEAAARAYIRLLQGLRWQQMTVRGEERVVLGEGEGVDDARVLHRGFEELGPGDLGVLLGALREAGLGELGATLMK